MLFAAKTTPFCSVEYALLFDNKISKVKKLQFIDTIISNIDILRACLKENVFLNYKNSYYIRDRLREKRNYHIPSQLYNLNNYLKVFLVNDTSKKAVLFALGIADKNSPLFKLIQDIKTKILCILGVI
jgi:hypothetical protein